VSDSQWIHRGLVLTLLCLGCCGGPGPVDAGSSGGTGGSPLVGPCSDAGLCPSDAYCLPELHACGTDNGLSVQTGAGNCYLSDPCNGGCDGEGCTEDLDCGETLECDPAGACCNPSSGDCTSGVFGTGGGTGGGTTPQCISPPSPCPSGCKLFSPPHGCTTCLCTSCPDAGTDAG
jgi:hypothetical protein